MSLDNRISDKKSLLILDDEVPVRKGFLSRPVELRTAYTPSHRLRYRCFCSLTVTSLFDEAGKLVEVAATERNLGWIGKTGGRYNGN